MSKGKNNPQKYDEFEGIRKKRLKDNSRHNFKTHLEHVIEDGDWDLLEDELYEESHSNHRW